MMKAFLVFPHQLFEDHFEKEGFDFHLIEDPLYFSQYHFHKQKLVLHRASMKYYEQMLLKKGMKARYWEEKEVLAYADLVLSLQEAMVEEVHYCFTSDDWLEQRITKAFSPFFRLVIHSNPQFLTPKDDLKKEFEGIKHLSMATFYMNQRKRRQLLMEGKKPQGGKWSYDEENRKKLPQNIVPLAPWQPQENEFVKEAKRYVMTQYADHYGQCTTFYYATTHQEAKNCLKDFLKSRFALFGPYEDAISRHSTYVFHSVLSPYLNTGLLLPHEVVDEAVAYAKEYEVSLPSLEGFIRQIVGWREFMHGVYLYRGRRERTVNFWDHTRKLPSSFWTGSTGIAPVDMVIKRVLQHGYTHHIERLMVMGNFMLLCEIDPDEAYKWFMEMYIDAYDWVMVPNVYTMSQYAGGGTATTKPYISGSNYLLKMSDVPKGEWCDIWDSLYWRFIDRYRDFFEGNPRLSVMTLHLKKMGVEQLKEHHQRAEVFLEKLTDR